MARQQTRRQFVNFVGGLNTEASPLTFPEGAAKALDNVELNRNGSIKRRRGLDYEIDGVYSSDSFTAAQLDRWAISTHEWKSVGGDDALNFLVLQIGGTLYFHNLGKDTLSLYPIGKFSLGPIKSIDEFQRYPVRSVVGKGKLFIVSRGISPAYIEYDKDENIFEGVKLTIKIRDMDGLSEGSDSPTIPTGSETPANQTDPDDDIGDVVDPLSSIRFSNWQVVLPGNVYP